MSGLYLVYIRGGVANVRYIYTWCTLEEGLQMSGLGLVDYTTRTTRVLAENLVGVGFLQSVF